MANIKPFRGVRYDSARVGDVSRVVSQPYDRITPELRERYYELSPYNVVRLIRGRESADDSETNNVYTRARDTYLAWLQDRVLIREPQPALYVLHQTFSLPDGRVLTRRGVIAALELTSFEDGVVLPHERTLAGPKMDRLHLMRAIPVNFGHVFMLHPGDGIHDHLESVIRDQLPAYEVRELFEHDVQQRLWIITDPVIVAAVAEEMAPLRGLIIADGHHRYETALTYRDEMRSAHPDAPADAAFNYVMVTFVSLEDPALVILPTHRLIHSLPDRLNSVEVLKRAQEYFEVQRVSGREEMEQVLAAAQPSRPRFGFFDGGYAVLTLRDPSVLDRLLADRAPAWRLLDVTVLHELLIERVLEINKAAVERKEHIEYLRDPQPGYEAVLRGEAQFLLLLNPTRIEQVRACVAAGERMPQKSTDFYPKVISGLVMMPVGPGERIP